MLKKILQAAIKASLLCITLLFVQTAQAAIVPVWGQAYSPNIGWINFYCDGSGGARPANINSSMGGSSTAATACSNISYYTAFDTTTNAFSGVAYSTNYGWLNLTGVTLSGNNLRGSSGANGMPTYNFGTTYFQNNQPNNYNPGVTLNSANAKLCGFAYSTAVGYISLCDTDSTYSLYDFNTYGTYLDKVAPSLTTANETFAADSAKPILLTFADGQTGLQSLSFSLVGANGNTVTCASNNANNLLGVASHAFTTTCNLSVAQTYDLTYTSCDVVSNCRTETIDDFYTVTSNTPSGGVNTLSVFEFSSPLPLKVADGAETHYVRLILRDSDGNRVTSIAGVKEVRVKFYFNNTTKLDQIARTGDAAKYTSNEFGLNQSGGSSTGFLAETPGGDGVWQINVASLTPTSAGYPPIVSDGFNLDFDHIDYEIVALGSNHNVGEGTGSASSLDSGRIFNFEPTLQTTPEAMSFDGGLFAVSSDAADNITINAPKRFQIGFTNASSAYNADSPEIGLLIDSDNSNILWGDAQIEAVNANHASADLTLDTDNSNGFNQSWNDLNTLLNTVPKDTDNSNKIRIRTTPVLTAGNQAPSEINTDLETYVSYEINGVNVKHKAGVLNLDLRNPSLDVVGLVSAEKNISGKQQNTISQSFGDIARNEAKLTINKNVQPLVGDSQALAKACNADLTLTQTSSFNTPSCLFLNKKVIFVNGNDVYLDGGGSSITLPTGIKTILIKGGNLHIRSNLVYSSRQDSFGVVVLKDAAGNGGNIYIYPSVTNVVGAYYAEGSVISVNDSGREEEDNSNTCDGSAGFCDRSFELRNQLYLKGSFATKNTVGGSDKNPLECPSGITCTSRAIARYYDLTYLRTYHENSGGTQAIGAASNSNAVVIEYDSRIQSTPPPLFSKANSSSSSEIGY